MPDLARRRKIRSLVFVEPPPSAVLAFIIGAAALGGAAGNESGVSPGRKTGAGAPSVSPAKGFRNRFLIALDNFIFFSFWNENGCRIRPGGEKSGSEFL